MSFEQTLIQYSLHSDLIPRAKSLAEEVALEFCKKKIPFKVVESQNLEVVHLQGPASSSAAALAQLRKIIAVDAEDHRRYSNLEIEQIGPREGEVRIYGTKGPPKSETIPSQTDTAKGPFFDADGEDADTYYPFLLKNQLDDDEPEVRLEFFNFDLLTETLGEDCELEGNTLGDVMMEVIDKKKLVKDHEGTHPGGYMDNCEGSTVLFHFNTLSDAIRVAEYFIKVFKSKKLLKGIFKSYRMDLNVDA